MTETEAARILAELKARYAKLPYDPTCDITIEDIRRALDCSEASARFYADTEVAADRLSVRQAYVPARKRHCNVYRRITPQ